MTVRSIDSLPVLLSSVLLCIHPMLNKVCMSLLLPKVVKLPQNVLFPGHNHLLTTGTDDPSL